MKPFYVYMLQCADGAYYIGHTDDLEARLGAHDLGCADGFTARRRPVALVWMAELETRDEAVTRERQLKGWSRAKKEALSRGDWDSILRLARRRGKPAP